MLKKYNPDFFKANLCENKAYRPFPPAAERQVWEKLQETSLNQNRSGWLIGQAEQIQPENWQVLPATLYMEFKRCGNRRNYETPYFKRRTELGILTVAECMEYQGRFLDSIANALWAILGEITWCIPAHHPCFENDPLPQNDFRAVDLFAAETGMVLAECYYLLRDSLEEYSPSLCARIKNEIQHRVIEPVLEDDPSHFWWLAGTNNWSPWCASNILGAGMYILDDRETLAKLCAEMTEVVDRYISNVPKDGGCDEGVTYWGVSAGTTLFFLEILHSATSGKVDIFSNPLIAKMGEFINKAHLTGPWFTGFADSKPKLKLRRAIAYRYGDRIKSQELMNLALLSMRNWQPDGSIFPLFAEVCGASLNHILRELFWMPGKPEAKPESMPLKVWLPELQFMVARNNSDGTGFTVAAKAGHNAENHNHNDVGQFIVYYDDQPLIVDLGAPEYTRDTFSEKRYLLEPIRGRGHNAPVINGFEQQPGREHKATQVNCESEPDMTFSMNMEEAYAAEAKIKNLHREMCLTPQGFTVEDSFNIDSETAEIIINMYSPADLSISTPGTLVFNDNVSMTYDPEIISAEIEKIIIDDKRMEDSWENSINKITLCYRGTPNSNYKLTFFLNN